MKYCKLYILLVFAILLSGCRTSKTAESEKLDSVRVEYKERIVKVPVEVYIEVPVESKQTNTNDSTSFLETSFAKSIATLTWRDNVPYLYHMLENKPQKIAKKDSVEVVEKEKVIRRVIRNTITKTVYKEWQPKWWQDGLMYIGGFSISISLFLIILILSKTFKR